MVRTLFTFVGRAKEQNSFKDTGSVKATIQVMDGDEDRFVHGEESEF